jgi:hypothetical protein
VTDHHRYGPGSRTHALALGGAVGLGGLGGGAGFGRLLVHLAIWRLLRRGGVALWRVPTAGPFLVIGLVLVIVVLLVYLRHRREGTRR